MSVLQGLKPEAVFRYFEELCAVPHGSGNMDDISRYCLDTAEKLGLRAVSDASQNVIVYKAASPGYETAEPIILQGHLDMVCQKVEGSTFDFEQDGIRPMVEGDWIRADGTTLGADNGIAVAMILAILEDQTLEHPPIEALFTVDEEIGLCGAAAISGEHFAGKRLVNLDSEDFGVITVSCAGGSEVALSLPLEKTQAAGTRMTVALRGLQGGHSGVEIDKGRVNADLLLGRVLNHVKTPFALIAVNGGDKGNAIPLASAAELLTSDAAAFCREVSAYWAIVKAELSDREPGAELIVTAGAEETAEVMSQQTQEQALFLMTCAPSGIMDMSMSIENLVETSLNLGVLETKEDVLYLLFALRSNKQSALDALEEKLTRFGRGSGCTVTASGHYPPWEYRDDSPLRRTTQQLFSELFGEEPQVVAIHAGLECGVLTSKIEGLDCISIGPDMKDVHTAKERLSVSSTEKTYRLLTELLKRCK